MAGGSVTFALEEHKSQVDAIVGDVVAGNRRKEVIAGLAELATSLAAPIPGLGALVKAVALHAFAEPANDILEKQKAEWETQRGSLDLAVKASLDLAALVTSAIESLVHDALAASIRMQVTTAESLELVIQDSLAQLVRRQDWWGTRLEDLIRLLTRTLSGVLVPGSRPLPARVSPAALLNAHFGVVPFVDALGAAEIQRLRAWLNDVDGPLVGALVGGGGSGKTRLAIEFCRLVAKDGWVAGFLGEGKGEQLVPFIESESGPVLVVLDYAEARPQLAKLLENLDLAAQGRAKRLRILLLARNASDWWTRLKTRDTLAHLLDEPILLGDIDIPPETRAQVFRAAVERFASHFSPIPLDPAEPDLSGEAYRKALFIQMAALARAMGDPPLPAPQLLGQALRHEEAFWSRLLDLSGHVEESVGIRQMRQFVASLTLVGGLPDAVAAKELADRSPGVRPGVVLAEVARVLYPGTYVGGLVPDILGEELVAQVLTDSATRSDWLVRLISASSADQSLNALIVLGRAASSRPDYGSWKGRFETIFRCDLSSLAFLAAEAALAVAEKSALSPIGAALAQVLREQGSWDMAHRIEALLPEHTVSLREVAVWTSETLLKAIDPSDRKERARTLINLGNRLRDLGRRNEALEATREAVDDYRRLAQAKPDEFLSNLAAGLNNLGIMLSELGRSEEALAETVEGTDNYRRLAEAKPDRFLPEFAASLNNLGIRLSESGRSEQALAPAREAVEIYRRLVEERQDAFLPDLAGAVGNLGVIFGELGRREDALGATRQAAEMYGRLVAEKPDRYLPNHAGILDNLGNKLGDLGKREEAFKATVEAVQSYRRLAEGRPDAFLPHLSQALSNLGVRLGALGRLEEALTATTEAIENYRRLASANPDAFLRHLAGSLSNFGITLSQLGRQEQALAATVEAVENYRRLAEANPDTFLKYLTIGLHNLGIRLSQLRRHEQALAVTVEAVEIDRGLAEASPDSFLPYLAGSLESLGARLADLGRREEALAAIREAIQIYRRLAGRFPERFGPTLASALGNLEKFKLRAP